MTPKMYYFGPWDIPGHYLFKENGCSTHREEDLLPWAHQIDGCLQPGCRKNPRNNQWTHERVADEVEGEALLHHKDGWTALSFWDRSVDTRFGCNSTYFAEGTFTFDEMVEMAKTRFSERWAKMNFKVRLVERKG